MKTFYSLSFSKREIHCEMNHDTICPQLPDVTICVSKGSLMGQSWRTGPHIIKPKQFIKIACVEVYIQKFQALFSAYISSINWTPDPYRWEVLLEVSQKSLFFRSPKGLSWVANGVKNGSVSRSCPETFSILIPDLLYYHCCLLPRCSVMLKNVLLITVLLLVCWANWPL